jgi:hypothetical protein
MSIDSDWNEHTNTHASELYLSCIYTIFVCVDLYVMSREGMHVSQRIKMPTIS